MSFPMALILPHLGTCENTISNYICAICFLRKQITHISLKVFISYTKAKERRGISFHVASMIRENEACVHLYGREEEIAPIPQ